MAPLAETAQERNPDSCWITARSNAGSIRCLGAAAFVMASDSGWPMIRHLFSSVSVGRPRPLVEKNSPRLNGGGCRLTESICRAMDSCIWRRAFACCSSAEGELAKVDASLGAEICPKTKPEKITAMADKPAIRRTAMEVNRAAESTFPAFEAHGEIRVQNNSPLSHAVAALNTARVFGEQDELTFAIDRSSKRVVIRLV